MAGIAFELKKLFKEDSGFMENLRAVMYSCLVSVGPWLMTIVTFNVLLFISGRYFNDLSQQDLFMGTIIYTFIFSQILTTPWQLLIVRYIADQLYSKSLNYIRPSFVGLSKIIILLSFLIPFAYYYDKALPLYYKFLAIALFVVISHIWILMVYLGAIKNYRIISLAFILGSITSLVCVFVILQRPAYFVLYQDATNLLIAYIVGVLVTYSILLHSFFSTFDFGRAGEFNFITYFKKVPSLFFIGLFYILGLWADDIIVWFSSIGINIYSAYQFAPLYDNAVYFSFLTIIPTFVIFMVSMETGFYDYYKKFYNLIGGNGTYEQISIARQEMVKVIFTKLAYIIEIQAVVSLTIIIISRPLFTYFNIPIIVSDIFKITTLGALCTGFVLTIILIQLYFEARKEALLTSIVFFAGNVCWTLVFVKKGVTYFGFGFFIGSFCAFAFGLLLLTFFLKDLIFRSFFSQPLFLLKQASFYDTLVAPMEKQPEIVVNEALPNRSKKRLVVISFLLILLSLYFLSVFKEKMRNTVTDKKLIAIGLRNNPIVNQTNLVGHETINWSKPEFSGVSANIAGNENNGNRSPRQVKFNIIKKNGIFVAMLTADTKPLLNLSELSDKRQLFSRAVTVSTRINNMSTTGKHGVFTVALVKNQHVIKFGSQYLVTITKIDAKSANLTSAKLASKNVRQLSAAFPLLLSVK